jgi:iron(III) transport system substrate-binding protein
MQWRSLTLIVLLLAGASLAILLLPGFLSGQEREVVVYTSVDQVYAEPVLLAFQEESGIRVRAVYDVEAAKTTGLVNRIITEQGRAGADVFWNGEVAQTLLLQERGLLEPYRSPSSDAIPPQFRDPDGHWTGFGGRARVILVNTMGLSSGQVPDSILDLANPAIPPERIGIAYPLFGTTATQAAAFYALWGPDEARAFYQSLADRHVRVVDGNSVIRDLVAAGDLWAGLTDSDDACGAVERGAPVRIVIPDQEPGGMGTLVIPNTVALVRGGAHPAEGRALVDYLVSPRVEEDLVRRGWFQVALRPTATAPGCLPEGGIRGMNVTFPEIAAQGEQARTELAAVFIR